MSTIVRFAPSPTGKLHVGNIRTAIVTWLYARHNDGQFVLRIDDTDQERSKEEYVDAIQRDLKWLGLDWDRFERQSGRMDKYESALDKLKKEGRLYPCYETPEELSLKRKAQLNQGLPPIYDRAALKLTDEQIAKYEAEGRTPHWRFKLNHDPIVWNDHVRGKVEFHGKDMSDPVLVREDGSPLYHICSVVDDIEYNITEVIRGEDHVSNTASHVQMFEALGATPPNFAHIALLTAKDGSKLSKRTGSLSAEELRDDEHFEPLAILAVLARLGTADPIEAVQVIDQLVETFDFGKFSRAAAKFQLEDIKRINAQILHETDYVAIKPQLDTMDINIDEGFWNVVRQNIETLEDVKEWHQIAQGPVDNTIEDDDIEFIQTVADCMPDGPWDEKTWSTWLNEIKSKSDRKGKSLFMPIRKALTGMNHGPELGDLLPLIGYERAKARLTGQDLKDVA